MLGNKKLSQKEKFARNFIVIPLSIVCLIIIVLQIISGVSPTYWVVSSLWALALLAGFRIMAGYEWLPKTPDEKEFRSGKFCESFEENSSVVQPINTWTNLGFVASGLMIVLIAGHLTASTPSTMADSRSWVPLIYGMVVIFLGPGSMLFHASGKKWAGWFDTFSMIAWIGYSFSYTFTRLAIYRFKWPPESLGATALVIVVGLGVYTAAQGLFAFKAGKERKEDGLGVIKLLGGLWIISELLTMILIWTGHPPGFRRSTSWLVAALIAYAAAFVCWIPSTGELKILTKHIPHIEKLWCNPDSPYQGHGFWHLFAALGALLIYLHYASESPI